LLAGTAKSTPRLAVVDVVLAIACPRSDPFTIFPRLVVRKISDSQSRDFARKSQGPPEKRKANRKFQKPLRLSAGNVTEDPHKNS
jgi:hypothetical protein